ncbi:Alpha/Beta hydrolase protein [Aspergillus nidulans var. acristatus]
MDDNNYHAAVEAQRKIKAEALKVTVYVPPGRTLVSEEPEQCMIVHKAGTQAIAGALPLPIDIVLHENVPMKLSDGITLYCDIVLPLGFTNLNEHHSHPVPALIAWTPYGKQRSKPHLDDFPFRAGVPRRKLSGLETFEGPDPAFWCAHNYAVVNVDIRGAAMSEGDLVQFGHQEAEDGAEFVTWVSEQPWCNGKVALTGNSFLAISQWRIGSLRPKGLAALAPWEGFSDFYRHQMCAGGIPFVGFHNNIKAQLTGKGRMEDPVEYIESHNTWDVYWEDKLAHPEWISVPVYVVGSWTNLVHTPGTFKAWKQLPGDLPKWLRVHNSMEWPDYYDDNSQQDLLRFFDYYLRGKTDNDWISTPKVRPSVFNSGLTSREDTVNRAELDFPLPRTEYKRYYLTPSHGLTLQPGASGGLVRYDSTCGTATFEYEIPAACETTGYFMAHLVMSCEQHDEMDVFVRVHRLSSDKRKQGVLPVTPKNAVLSRILKFIHDRQLLSFRFADSAFHWGPDGQLRAGFALNKDTSKSRTAEPFYTFEKRVPLKKGEVRELDIPLRPYGMYWERGDILQLVVSGHSLVSFPIPDIAPHSTENKGVHIIHCCMNGSESSYLLVPHV